MAKITNKESLKKRIQTQNMIIIALAIVIFVLVVVSGTAAWYIRTRSDSADIILSNPVNIYITEFKELKDSTGNIIRDKDGNPLLEHELKTDILEDYNTRVYPGDKIKLKLGMQLGNDAMESSPAYVRVKLGLTYEKIGVDGSLSGLEPLAEDGLIEYKDKPDENIWELVDFNKYKILNGTSTEHDYWYVLKTKDSAGRTIAKIAQNKETFVFVDGYVALSKTNITNVHANCKFHINYIVEAIQKPHVPDPIANEGYGPWWDFALGDDEDLEG